ncbi:MAG: hypothetical protein JWM74_1979, partial [Myxococcaceae bacterium]|nr:hypothetical protein [Myxococcaceae bacterium]
MQRRNHDNAIRDSREGLLLVTFGAAIDRTVERWTLHGAQ